MNDFPSHATASLAAALLAGVTYGATFCGPSCGPFLCTYIMGTQNGGGQGLRAMAVFSAARILTYGAVGFASALVGTTLLTYTSTFALASFLPGLIVVALGVAAWFRPTAARQSGRTVQIGESPAGCSRARFLAKPSAPLWLAGVVFAIAPCPPMLAMMACSANAGSPLTGAAVMMLFGVGTSLSPLIAMCLLAGTFSQKIRRLAPQQDQLFRRTAAVTLMLLGTAMVFGPP